MTTEMDVGMGEGWVARRAKLFEAGEYPDKGIAVSYEDLVALAAGFEGPAPVLIEHAESPLELGFLTAVSHEGRELHGTIRFSPEADALVRRSGARGLSLGLSLGLSPDLRSIREVSLVRRPRVAGAGLFSDAESVVFSGELLDREQGAGGTTPSTWEATPADSRATVFASPPSADPPTVPPSGRSSLQGEPSPDPHPSTWGARSAHPWADPLPHRSGAGFPDPSPLPLSPGGERGSELARLVKEGRMVPAQVPFAEALLAHEGAVEFSGDRRPLRELLIAMLERQPPLHLFGQTAPTRAEPERPATMLPEEAAFYTRHFPGVPLTAIAQAKGG